LLSWALLVVESAASLAASVAVAEQTMTGRLIAAWPSFSLIAAYELPMRQVRRAADGAASGGRHGGHQDRRKRREPAPPAKQVTSGTVLPKRRKPGRNVQLEVWRWARDNRAEDGSLPSGRDIGSRYGRHEQWGWMVKRSGMAGELGT
jgi:hypothetical protein